MAYYLSKDRSLRLQLVCVEVDCVAAPCIAALAAAPQLHTHRRRTVQVQLVRVPDPRRWPSVAARALARADGMVACSAHPLSCLDEVAHRLGFADLLAPSVRPLPFWVARHGLLDGKALSDPAQAADALHDVTSELLAGFDDGRLQLRVA